MVAMLGYFTQVSEGLIYDRDALDAARSVQPHMIAMRCNAQPR